MPYNSTLPAQKGTSSSVRRLVESSPESGLESSEENFLQVSDWAYDMMVRLAQYWRGTLLTMQSNSQDLTAPDMSSAVRADIASALLPQLNKLDFEAISTVLAKAEIVLASFLQRSVVTGIDRNGLVDLTSLAVQSCADPTLLQTLEMRIGFGASPTEIPNARVPAYILAAKNILTSLGENGCPLPTAVLYSASRFVAAVNDGDGEKVERAAQANFDLIRSYITRFAPGLGSSFTFDADRMVQPGEMLDSLIRFYSRALEDASNPDSCDARDKVVGIGLKNGSTKENALRYAAAHALYASDPVPGAAESILQRSQSRPRSLVMIGGEPEKTFWRVRETVKQGVTVQGGIAYFRERIAQLNCPMDSQGYQKLLDRFIACSENGNGAYLRAQLISQAGQMPVYGMYKGDWTLRDVAERSFDDLMAAPFDLRMKRDLLAVLCDIAGLPLDKAYSVTNKKPLAPDTRERLAAAYGNYADFCREFLSQIPS